MTHFEISLGEPINSDDFYLAPEDPLNELTPLAFGLMKYLYEHNREVTIRLDGETAQAELFPDVSLLMDELPGKLAGLDAGEPQELGFPEKGFALECTPHGAEVDCVLRRFGYQTGRSQHTVPRAAFLGALRDFLDGVVKGAMAGGYIDPADALALLAAQSRGTPPA